MPGAATVAPEPSQEPSADAGAATPPPPKLSADDALNSEVPDYLKLGLTYLGAAKFCLEELKLIKEFVVLDTDREAQKAKELMKKIPNPTALGKSVAKLSMDVGHALGNAALGTTGGPKLLPNGGRWPTGVPCMTRQTLILSNMVGNWKSVGHVRSLLWSEEEWQAYVEELLQKEKQPTPDLSVYDLIVAVKKWLKIHAEGDDESVVEVLQRKGWGKKYLGPAKVFLSHSQAEHPAEMMAGLIAAAFEVAGLGDTSKPGAKWNKVPVWIDAFSMRQTATRREDRWNPNQVAALIKKIGCTVATIDKTELYLKRSNCILESYATITTGGKLTIRPALNDWMPDIFEAENTDENRMDMGTHAMVPLFKGIAYSSPAFPCCCLAYWLAPQVKVDSGNTEAQNDDEEDDKKRVNSWILERHDNFEVVNQTMEREMRKQQGMLGCNRAMFCLNASLICCCIPSPCLCLLHCQCCLPRWYKKLCVPMVY